jgi:glycosyltransferase involved in cell wall biosynthesis
MMLGSDVSSLSTTAANAAAQGLSIVVPVYNEAAGLAALHERLNALAASLRQRFRLSCEVVYVDDGSTDATLSMARSLKADALDVQLVSLSRNFGKEAALMAGLDHARRGAVMFMDGDGQHPPALVEQLVSHWIEGGYDVVYTAKAHRENEPLLRRLSVHGFYALINWGARQKMPATSACSPRARWPHSGNCRNATASSRASRAGSASSRSVSTTSRSRARTASPRSTSCGCSASRSKA